MKTIKFENLKLPDMLAVYEFVNAGGTVYEAVHHYCRAVFDQMKAHYEGKDQPTPEWRLPDPPPGQQWHRDDWTQDMLPEGYRPLLLGEVEQEGDEWFSGRWENVLNSPQESLPGHSHHRTRRPLPAPVEYVPLGPEDVPPGTVLRGAGEKQDAGWCMIISATRTGIRIWRHSEGNGYEIRWRDIMDNGAEILRPGSSTWEPCKKIKK